MYTRLRPSTSELATMFTSCYRGEPEQRRLIVKHLNVPWERGGGVDLSNDH